ncbi:MAG: preprotein translocase subunit YajC [Pseudonocardiaceae bacterium]
MDLSFLPLLFIALLALPLILSTRRQKRAMAQAQQLQNSLTNGDRVITTSGLHGTVVGSGVEATVDLEIAPGVRTTWLRAAIREKITENGDEAGAAGTSKAGAPEAAPIDNGARADNS